MKTKLLFTTIFSLLLLIGCTTDDSVLNEEKKELKDINPMSPDSDQDDLAPPL